LEAIRGLRGKMACFELSLDTDTRLNQSPKFAEYLARLATGRHHRRLADVVPTRTHTDKSSDQIRFREGFRAAAAAAG
jgi:hypothetical protein